MTPHTLKLQFKKIHDAVKSGEMKKEVGIDFLKELKIEESESISNDSSMNKHIDELVVLLERLK